MRVCGGGYGGRVREVKHRFRGGGGVTLEACGEIWEAEVVADVVFYQSEHGGSAAVSSTAPPPTPPPCSTRSLEQVGQFVGGRKAAERVTGHSTRPDRARK